MGRTGFQPVLQSTAGETPTGPTGWKPVPRAQNSREATRHGKSFPANLDAMYRRRLPIHLVLGICALGFALTVIGTEHIITLNEKRILSHSGTRSGEFASDPAQPFGSRLL